MKNRHIQILRSRALIRQQLGHDGEIPQFQQVPALAAAIEGKGLAPFIIQGIQLLGNLCRVRHFRDCKMLSAAFQQGLGVKGFQPPHQAVGGEYHQAVIFHVHQHHHHITGVAQAVLTAITAEVYRCLIPVVAVGNIELPRGKVLAQGLDGHRVIDKPQPVGYQAVAEFISRGVLGEVFNALPGGALLVHIEGINLAEIASGGLHQVQTVLFGLAQGLLVGEHRAFGKGLCLHQADEALDFLHRAVGNAGQEFFFINVEARLAVLAEDALLQPGFQGFSGLLIGIFAPGQLQADDVAGIDTEIFLALVLADNIIRGTGQRLDLPGLVGKPHSAEGFDFSHGFHSFIALVLYYCNG